MNSEKEITSDILTRIFRETPTQKQIEFANSTFSGLLGGMPTKKQIDIISSYKEKFSEAFYIIYGKAARKDTLLTLSVRQTIRHEYTKDHSQRTLFRQILGGIERTFQGDVSSDMDIRFRQDDLIFIKCNGFNMYIDSADWGIGAGIPGDGKTDWEETLSAFIRKNLKPGMTFIDIGANIGFFSLLACSIVGPNGKVIAFEPVSENARLILINSQLNNFSVDLNCLAAGYKKEWAAIAKCTGTNHLAYFSSNLDQTHSFVDGFGENFTIESDPNKRIANENLSIIQAVPIDSFYQHADFIKVDVEGGEYRALLGAKSLIQNNRPIIACEFSPGQIKIASGMNANDLLKWFASLNYKIYIINNDIQNSEIDGDIDSWVARHWSNPHTVENLAFIPSEKLPAAVQF